MQALAVMSSNDVTLRRAEALALTMCFSPNPLVGLVIGLNDGVLSAVSTAESKHLSSPST